MKAQRITNRNQIVGGQFYIRAVISMTGIPFCEVYQLNGKPRVYNSCGEEYFVVDDAKGRFQFTGDLGMEERHEFLALFKFNNKLFNHLNALKNDTRKFADFIEKKIHSDEEWSNCLCDFEMEQRTGDVWYQDIDLEY